MLQFFRKHQKFFFLFITVIIIVTFVFFGTFQAFLPKGTDSGEEVVFTSLNGDKVSRRKLNTLVHFLSDEKDPLARFYNEGIISTDFLETKLGELVFLKWQDAFKEKLLVSHQREKNFQPYTHPEARFLNAETVWGLFAPDVKENLKKLKSIQNPQAIDIFKTKVALYLAEKKFPGEMLAQVLMYQEKDHPTIPKDPRLHRGDSLSLYGYRDLNDWFGEAYIESLAKVILNSASFAKQKGLNVTNEEAGADLMMKSEKAFAALKNQLPPQISSPKHLFSIFLRQRGLDEAAMVALWKDVLLFRRLFNDVGSTVVGDALPMKEFYSVANEKIALDVYTLDPSLHLKNKDELLKFEAYITALQSERKSPLELPTKIDDLREIEKRAPMLIAYPYLIDYKKVEKKELHGKISARETLEWQLDPKNWEILEKKFTDLKGKGAGNAEQKNEAIASLPTKRRLEVDRYSRIQIIKNHPEWVENALREASSSEKRIVVREGLSPLPGIKDQKAFKELLDQKDEIASYTQDQEAYYTIKVRTREGQEILPFSEVKKLDLPPVSGDIVKEIREQMKKENVAIPESDDHLAPYRFFAYLKKRPQTLSQDPVLKQWNLIKKEEEIARGSKGEIPFDQAAQLGNGNYSNVLVSNAFGPFFYQVKERKEDKTLPIEKMIEAQQILSQLAKEQFFMRELLPLIEEKKGLEISKT